jgi:hypothetical protein
MGKHPKGDALSLDVCRKGNGALMVCIPDTQGIREWRL